MRGESTLYRALRARLNDEISDDQFFSAIRGACGEDEFLDAIALQITSAPELTASLISAMQRPSRRGEVRSSLIRQLHSRIADRLPGNSFDDITIELPDASGSGYLIPARPVPTCIATGTVLCNRYVIEECLGIGGKGTVFKALDRHRSELRGSRQYVALKVLHQASDSRLERLDALEAMRRELQSARALSHPNVVKVFDLHRQGGLSFFTMEFLEGELLSSLLTRFRPQRVPRVHAWSIIAQIAAGLQHAHERGIVHADLKPQNILISNSGEVRILDFGASHSLTRKTRAGHVPSAPTVSLAYASSELLSGSTPEARDDLYALACISYELLSGSHPFNRRSANEARDLGLVAARPQDLSRRQWNQLARGLAWNRAARPMHVSDWLKGLNVQISGEAPQPPAKMPYFRASIAATLLLITGLAWLLFVRVAPGGKVVGEAIRPLSAVAPESSADPPIVLSAAQPDTPQVNADAGAISPPPPRVAVRARFAEIRVRRPASVSGNAPFVWWTEGASARPGIDYMNQSKATQFFPAGRNSASVFVKLLPRPSGSSSGVFYIAVAERADQDPQHVTHTAVRLPSNST
jgi:serine/threonine protein kinase